MHLGPPKLSSCVDPWMFEHRCAFTPVISVFCGIYGGEAAGGASTEAPGAPGPFVHSQNQLQGSFGHFLSQPNALLIEIIR